MGNIKILYFVNGNSPNKEDIQKAGEIKANVHFRNAGAVPPEDHAIEICDGVAGCVPLIYAEMFPTAEQAITNSMDSLQALAFKVGDVPAPKLSRGSNKTEESA